MLVLLALALVAASVVSAPDLAHAQPTPNRAAEYTADERPRLRCGVEQALDVDFEGTGRLYRAEWRRCGPPGGADSRRADQPPPPPLRSPGRVWRGPRAPWRWSVRSRSSLARLTQFRLAGHNWGRALSRRECGVVVVVSLARWTLNAGLPGETGTGQGSRTDPPGRGASRGATSLMVTSHRPRHPGPLEDRLVDAARGHAIADRVERGHLALQSPVQGVGGAAAHRQHHRIDALDPTLHPRVHIGDHDGGALQRCQIGVTGQRHAVGEQPRVQGRDRGDPHVLAGVEEPRDHLDAAAAVEQVLGGGQSLLGVDVVHDYDPLADLGALEEDIAIGHDVLAVEPGKVRPVRKRSGRDDHDFG